MHELCEARTQGHINVCVLCVASDHLFRLICAPFLPNICFNKMFVELVNIQRLRPFTMAQRVNQEVERAMRGGPHARWSIFPNGTVVMRPSFLVSGDDVGIESERYLRRN